MSHNIKNLAELARLHLTPEEEQKFASQFTSILEYIDSLTALDVQKREERHLIYNVMQADVEDVADVTQRMQLIKNLPHAKDDYAVVKKVLPQE